MQILPGSPEPQPPKSWLRRLAAALRPRRSKVRTPEQRIAELRRRGVRIGSNCLIFTDEFSTEPYLIELGDDVGIAGGTVFITHEGVIRMLRTSRPSIKHFGKIKVGNNTHIGQNCIILPGTTIGAQCIVGAGSVVRGNIPDNSLIAGNPAVVVGRASLVLELLLNSPDTFDAYHLSYEDRERLLRKHFNLAPPSPPK